MADKIGICQQDAGRIFVSLEYADGLARLDEQSLVVIQRLQSLNNGVVAIPIASCFARAAVDHEVLRTLGDFFVEVVHEHAHGGFLLPALAGESVAAWRANASGGSGLNVGFDRHANHGIALPAKDATRRLRRPLLIKTRRTNRERR